jgi:pimeloyl-ACP methyl ester carboxylesterase
MKTTRFQLPEPRFINVGGVTIATYELSPKRDEPAGDVVFCHGTPWSAEVWAEAAHHLSSGYRVFLWDMPGYGRSAKDKNVSLALPSQMVRLTQLLAHWRLDKPHLVAHDIGGAVALGAHLLHGTEYASLFLWDVVTLDPWGSPFFRLVAEHADVFAALPRALHAALVAEYISGAARHQLPESTVAMLAEPWQGSTGQPAFYRQIAQLSSDHTRPITARLHEVRCATSIGWGEQDPWIAYDQAIKLQERLPGNPPLTTLADTGHLTPLEAPALVQSALDNWLNSRVTPGRGNQNR